MPHIQTVKGTVAGGTTVSTGNITTTPGNLLVVGVGSWTSGAAQNATITDSKGNTWSANPSNPKDPHSASRIQQFYAPNCLGGSTHNFTATFGSDAYAVIIVSEFSAVAPSSALDKNAGAIGESTAPSSGVTATRAQADELLVGLAGTSDAGNVVWNAGSGFTIPANGEHGDSSQYVLAQEYQIVSAVGTDAAVFAMDAAKPWAAILGTFKLAVAAPAISPNGGSFANPVEVTLTCATSGASIYYTLDGSTPDATKTLYSAPFTLSSTATLKTIGIKAGMPSSGVVSAVFTIAVATPTISPNGGSFVNPTGVTLACATSGASIYYTIDGTTPDATKTLYTVPFTLSADATVKAIGIKTGISGAVASAVFTITIGSSSGEIRHCDIPGYLSHISFNWIQATDPDLEVGVVLQHKHMWLDTSVGRVKFRPIANNEWVII